MKYLLRVTAVLELGAGIALLTFPSATAVLLLGSELDTPAATLGRVTGSALLALGVGCWMAQQNGPGRAARGMVGAMVVYNLGAVLVLGIFGIGFAKIGVALWPAVALHAIMTVWCLVQLLAKRTPDAARG